MSLLAQYDGLIFDYGGVLAFHQTPADQERMAAVAGLSIEQFEECYWAERFDYDKAALAGGEYWLRLGLQAGVTLTPAQIAELTELDTVSWMQFDPVMWEWIDELRAAGKRLALLSNMPRELGEALRARTDRFERFHHVTLSYELESAKPEAAIYEECLKGIKTAPGRTLFLDDRIANVHGAERLGIAAMQFTSREEILPQLRS